MKQHLTICGAVFHFSPLWLLQLLSPVRDPDRWSGGPPDPDRKQQLQQPKRSACLSRVLSTVLLLVLSLVLFLVLSLVLFLVITCSDSGSVTLSVSCSVLCSVSGSVTGSVTGSVSGSVFVFLSVVALSAAGDES